MTSSEQMKNRGYWNSTWPVSYTHLDVYKRQSAYYSLNGTYIKNFGIPDFTEKDIDFLINEPDQSNIDSFLEDYYNIKL